MLYQIATLYIFNHDSVIRMQVVSGLGREIPSPAGVPIPGAIQTDAAINAGNNLHLMSISSSFMKNNVLSDTCRLETIVTPNDGLHIYKLQRRA